MEFYESNDPALWLADRGEGQLENLTKDLPNNVFVKTTDIIWPNELDHDIVIGDTVFSNTPSNYYSLAPELWGTLFTFDEPVAHTAVPTKQLNFLANRVSGERLLMFYKLAERNLVDNNHISFNCATHLDPYGEAGRFATVEQRQQAFEDMHQECGWSQYNSIFEAYKPKIPIVLEFNDTIATALDSVVTIVVETYASETATAYSEKIFRALQTPRPWVMYCSVNSVRILRDFGFDVLDDLVDHSCYDDLYFDKRIDAMLDQLPNIKLDLARCEQAAAHNNQLLKTLGANFNKKYASVLEEINK